MDLDAAIHQPRIDASEGAVVIGDVRLPKPAREALGARFDYEEARDPDLADEIRLPEHRAARRRHQQRRDRGVPAVERSGGGGVMQEAQRIGARTARTGALLGAMERRDAGYPALRGRPGALADPAEFHHGDAPQGPHPAADGPQGMAGPRPQPRRTLDQTFVAVPWDEVLDLLAGELSRVRPNMARAPCSAAPTAGPARVVSTTRRARCIAS